MSRLVVFIAVLWLGAISVLGASPTQNDSIPKYAFQFHLYVELPRLLHVSSFSGSLISGMYRINRNSAVRVGLDMAAQQNKYEYSSKQIYFTADSLNKVFNSKTTIKYFGLKLSMDYLRYWRAVKRVAGYAGMGVSFGLNRRKYDYSRDDGGNQSDFWGGFYVLLGVEWSISNQAQLGMEYRFNLLQKKRSVENFSRSLSSELWQGEGKLISIILSIGL